MASDLTVRGGLNAQLLHRGLMAARPHDPCVIDLQRGGWATPGGIVGVACFAEKQVKLGRPVRLAAPLNPNKKAYLSRMRLGSVLDGLGVEHDLLPVREHTTRNSLLELSRFSSDDEIEALAEVAMRAMTPRDRNAASKMAWALAEMGQNVKEHSLRRHGYLAAQMTRDDKHLIFSVGDSGRGFLAGLQERHDDLQSEKQALDGVLGSRQLTRTGSGGCGLTETRKAAAALNGAFWLSSGNATAIATRSKVRLVETERSLPGTLLQVSFSC